MCVSHRQFITNKGWARSCRLLLTVLNVRHVVVQVLWSDKFTFFHSLIYEVRDGSVWCGSPVLPIIQLEFCEVIHWWFVIVTFEGKEEKRNEMKWNEKSRFFLYVFIYIIWWFLRFPLGKGPLALQHYIPFSGTLSCMVIKHQHLISDCVMRNFR